MRSGGIKVGVCQVPLASQAPGRSRPLEERGALGRPLLTPPTPFPPVRTGEAGAQVSTSLLAPGLGPTRDLELSPWEKPPFCPGETAVT